MLGTDLRFSQVICHGSTVGARLERLIDFHVYLMVNGVPHPKDLNFLIKSALRFIVCGVWCISVFGLERVHLTLV